jgi:hypothetical protein
MSTPPKKKKKKTRLQKKRKSHFNVFILRAISPLPLECLSLGLADVVALEEEIVAPTRRHHNVLKMRI